MSITATARTGRALRKTRAELRRASKSGDPVAGIFDIARGQPAYDRYDRLRARGDIVRGRNKLVATATYQVCREVLRDKRFGAVPTAAAKFRMAPPRWQRSELLVHPLDDSFASADPPEHAALRKIVAPWFTAPAMRQLRGLVEQIVEDELDALAGKSEVDLISSFALRVPSRVICKLLGLAERDHLTFCRWGIEFGRTVDGARSLPELRGNRKLLAEMADYFADLAAKRRREPADDLFTAMVEAVADGRLTERGLLATAEALLIGGFVTTSNIIGNAVVQLEGAPKQRDRFIDEPGLAENLVEEVLRIEAPAQYSVRITHEPVELADVALPARTPVMTLLAGANRDPAEFAEPNRFEIARVNARDHLSFAAGIHYCIGAGLARLEGEIALRSLYARHPGLRIAGTTRYCPSRVIRGPQHLPVRL